ncbi:MAG: ASPIC/UnbV domain-containing protein, partial [Caldilineaceae bacterium]|nr:ASPIC/UnbV domain-containing protein [Caldilineaceae bacterium]
NGDGALDLVTGSYGAELKQHGIIDPVQDPQSGVIVYTRTARGFVPQVLDPAAETLSIGLLDPDGGVTPAIWVANDFALRDQLWTYQAGVWTNQTPFNQTSHSTMSLDWGDITGTGELALFSTDMNPYDIAPATLAQWLPVFDQMGEHRERGDPQVMANVLEVRTRGGGWQNLATQHGVDASGWSWAGRFGDLDNDGALDLYVVNGMIAADMFGHLPNGELVEENQAYRNMGRGEFAPAPHWQLNSTASGRGMVMADLDDDGDLDIVVNNLRSAAQLFENQLCGGGSMDVELRWPQSGNSRAIGAQVRLQTDTGFLQQDVRASGGYLSGDPIRIHFGLGAATRLDNLEVLWPDGAISRLETPTPGTHLTITRTDGAP